MKKLAVAAIVAAVLAMGTSGAALYRTRHLSSSNTTPTSSIPSQVPTSNAGLVEVPDTTNQTVYGAAGLLSLLGLKSSITRAPSNEVTANSVISQNPVPGLQVPPGTVVELTVSSGPS